MSRSLPVDWNKRRGDVLERDNYSCVNCGKSGNETGVSLHTHHIVPREAGGTHKLSNLTTLCKKCHYSVHYPNFQSPTSKRIIDYDRFLNAFITPPEQRSDSEKEYLNEVVDVIEKFADRKDELGDKYYPLPEPDISLSELADLYDSEEKSDITRWKNHRAEWIDDLSYE